MAAVALDHAPGGIRRGRASVTGTALGPSFGAWWPRALDLTPLAGDQAFADATAAVLADPGVHAGIVGCVPLTGALATLPGELGRPGGVTERLVALWRTTTKGFVTVVDSGPLSDPFAAALAAGGLPVFRSADRAVRFRGA